MRPLKIAVLAAFLLQLYGKAFSQTAPMAVAGPLAKKFEYYSAKNQKGVLFVHFDKTTYIGNEYAWFSAYLLNDTTTENNILSVAMVNDDDHSVFLRDKFVMKKGRGSGNMFIPDTIPPGNYSFIAYTNMMLNDEPEHMFTQQITIKGTQQLSYNAGILLQDTMKVAPVYGRKVLLVTSSPDGKLMAGAEATYYLGNDPNGEFSGTVTTDNAGQYLFTVPNTSIKTDNNVLHVSVKLGNELKTLKLEMPVQGNIPAVRFYPEGGDLAEGIKSVIGWELKNPEGAVIAAKGTLYKDGKPVDTVSANEYGMGRFTLTPAPGSSYYVKLSGYADPVYNLPKAKANLPVINIVNAVVNDTLRFNLKSPAAGKWYVLVHNYQQTFSMLPVQADMKGANISIPLASVPKGVAEVTVLDSLQQPYAERIFFAHYDQRNTATITADSSQYKTRQKVNVKLDLKGPDGKPLSADVSIAVVQAGRMDPKKVTDIESYFYLKNALGNLPVKDNYLGKDAADKAFLENVLLIKGWRRYTWADLMQTTEKDTVSKGTNVTFTGVITHLNKPIKKQGVLYTVTRDSSRHSFLSDPDGTFTLANNNLFVTPNEKVHLFVNGINGVDYEFNIHDPYTDINKRLAMEYKAPVYASADQQAAQESMKTKEHGILLKEVNIRGGIDTLINACGDYYCINNVLNCPNHHHDPRNKIPEPGKTYYIFNPLTESRKSYVYQGCHIDEPDAAKGFNGVHYNIEFYPADYSKDSPPAPEYLSTIYWDQQYKITPGTDSNISFYTSDITGDFKIIIQGVTDKGVVYDEKTISVDK